MFRGYLPTVLILSGGSARGGGFFSEEADQGFLSDEHLGAEPDRWSEPG